MQNFPQIDNLEILELIGRGANSRVYKARQLQLDRIVAVKILSRRLNEVGAQRFHREARLCSSLLHPNIVTTLSFGLSREQEPYLVMEYVKGNSLAEELKEGRLSLRTFKEIFLPALSALGFAHEKGIVHRDIKPENILICKEEEKMQVKIIDFGIAKSLDAPDEEITKTLALVGTPQYMSPEQCQGSKTVDARSDLYSLACVMYESLSGKPPFEGNSAWEIVQNHIQAPEPKYVEITRAIDVRNDLAKVTVWALAKNPANRPQTASDLAKKLSEVLERVTLDKVPRVKQGQKTTAPNSKNLIAAALVLAVPMTALFLADRLGKRPQKIESAIPNKLAAEDVLLRQLHESEKVFGKDSPRNLKYLERLLGAYIRKNDFDSASNTGKQILEIVRKDPQSTTEQLAEQYIRLGNLLGTQKRYQQGLSYQKLAYSILLKDKGKTHPMTVQAESVLGETYDLLGKPKDAEVFLLDALEQCKQIYEENNVETGIAYLRLARCKLAQQDLKAAQEFASKSLAIIEPIRGERNSLTKDVRNAIQDIKKAAAKKVAP